MSGHKYWCYPIDNNLGKLVRTVDLRLYYANYLANMAGDKRSTLLEVGAGSGFVSHYLASMGFNVEGSELSEYRVKGARLLGKIKGTTTNFKVGNLRELPYGNNSFDIVFSCFVLEQCQEIIEEAISECIRVARSKCIFFEPSIEFSLPCRL
jgi:2-polyprenyl-3-methyl-5-hydroxy-6-metoxy-1,4-benzoquinol methylase